MNKTHAAADAILVALAAFAAYTIGYALVTAIAK